MSKDADFDTASESDKNDEETETISCYTGLRLLFFEHNYSQNSMYLFNISEDIKIDNDNENVDENIKVPESKHELQKSIKILSDNVKLSHEIAKQPTETLEVFSKIIEEPVPEKLRESSKKDTLETCFVAAKPTEEKIDEIKNKFLAENVISSDEVKMVLDMNIKAKKVTNTSPLVPVRRSQRHLNKPDISKQIKDLLSNIDNALPDEMHKNNIEEKHVVSENLSKEDNIKYKIAEQEAKDISVEKKLLKNHENQKLVMSSKKSKKDIVLGSKYLSKKPQEKITPQQKHQTKNELIKSSLDNSNTCLTSPEGRRKRTYFKSPKNDFSMSSVSIEDNCVKRRKRLRSSSKGFNTNLEPKQSKTIDIDLQCNKRKRNVSSLSSSKNKRSEIVVKKENTVSFLKETMSNKAETKDSTANKEEFSFKGPSFPCFVKPIKQKKSVRKESLKLVINDDEPPLFSQPDVMVKIKNDESYPKKENTDLNTDNVIVLDVTKDVSVSEYISAPPVQIKNRNVNIESKLVIDKFTSVKPKQNISNYSFNEENLMDDNTKDIDSENSLQIDESFERQQSCKELSVESTNFKLLDNVANFSNLPFDTRSAANKVKKIGKSTTISNEAVQPNKDIDYDKPIAERKPRRIIKKKEFFEDISSRTDVQIQKSAGKQKGDDDKSSQNENGKSEKTTLKEESEDYSDESEEDDPEKLWCICRKPHNDRFMIQCDVCEDWFHGSCVGVSRHFGLKLEKEKIEWNCPNCLSKGSKSSYAKPEKSIEKDISVDENMRKVHKDFKLEVEKVILNKTSSEIPEKGQLITMHPRIPALRKSKTISVPVKKQILPSLPSTKSSASKIMRTSTKVMTGSASNKKVLNTTKKKQSCVICHAVTATDSPYCNNKCIELHVADCFKTICDSQGLLKGPELDSQKVVVLDCVKGSVIAGDNAPTFGEIIPWLKAHPNYMIACSSIFSNTKKESAISKKDCDSTSVAIEKTESSDESSKTVVRFNVRKTLKNILMERCKNADDIKIPEEDIRKIAVKIEESLHSLFKDNSFKYRAKYRSLMFNIKDPRNQGLFRKILKGNIPPDKLVRMSPEELASLELAKWREQENQHLLDMIKRVQLEQLSGSVHLKKTHKGDVEIEDDFTNIVEDLPKSPLKNCSDESIEVEKADLDKVIIKDTTHLHRSHLFDLNCKICTGKIIPAPVDETVQKKVRVAHSISIDVSSPTSADSIEKAVSQIVDGDDSSDQEPTSTVSIGSPENPFKSLVESGAFTKVATSVWKGFIYMQDVAKFVTSAYKVSGQTIYLHTDVPDTIQVCGRIIPDQVWDYLGKVKQSGNKELIIVRFQAANEEEAVTYNSFYSYLSSRKRYGVVSNYSKKIKDFYILPLAATSPVPIVLMPFDGPGLPSPRPHLLLGVIVRHKAKSTASSKKEKKKEVEKVDGSYTPPLDNRSYTPPLPTLSNENSVDIASEMLYSPSIDLKNKNQDKTEVVEPTHASSADIFNKSNCEKYESSFTPPLQMLTVDCIKVKDDDKPYDPEQGILNMDTNQNVTNPTNKDSNSSQSTENLEKHKKILDALTRQVEETDRQVNALKHLISVPDVKVSSPNSEQLDINSVTASGMSSFLDLSEKFQEIFNDREKVFNKEKKNDKCDADTKIKDLFNNSPDTFSKVNNVSTNQLTYEETISENESIDKISLTRPSDPRLKIKATNSEVSSTSKTDSEVSSTSKASANISLSNMSLTELMERAEKELAEIGSYENVHMDTLTTSDSVQQTLNPSKTSSWDQFKEPPPPGIDPIDLVTQDNNYSSRTPSLSNSHSSSFPPLVSTSDHKPVDLQCGSTAPIFSTQLPLGFSIPVSPNAKTFPSSNAASTSYLSLPIVSSANTPVMDTWSTKRDLPHAPKTEKTLSLWNDNMKHRTEKADPNFSDSSSHYFATVTHGFREHQYKKKPSFAGRWNRSTYRYGRNNWNKRPRGLNFRRQNSFNLNKTERN